MRDGDIKFVRLVREGWAGKYMAEYRVIASREIGRMLHRYEIVLHISGEKDDNSPDNLYVCDTREWYKIRGKKLPWPTKSNLKTYKGG